MEQTYVFVSHREVSLKTGGYGDVVRSRASLCGWVGRRGGLRYETGSKDGMLTEDDLRPLIKETNDAKCTRLKSCRGKMEVQN